MKDIKILVIEDEHDVADDIAVNLANIAAVTITNTGDDGEYELASGAYDLAVVDVMLPGVDGYTLVRDLRQSGSKMPVVMLTAKVELEDKMHGFEIGVDDYLTKPFFKEELVARIRALLKRSGALQQAGVYRIGNLALDSEKHTGMINEQRLDLTAKEFDLLVYIAQNAGAVLTKEQIFDRLWGFESNTTITVIEVFMSNIRKKLRQAQADFTLKAIRGIGYMVKRDE